MNKELKNEIWITIPDYEDYQISNYGRIKSLEKKVNGKWAWATYIRKEKILSPAMDGEGYLHVRIIRNDRKTVLWKVHQLMGLVFLGHDRKNNDGLVVDHIDGNRKNNQLSNLQLLDKIENIKKGQLRKKIERRLPEQTYYFNYDNEQITAVLNKLISAKYFQHIFVDSKNSIIHRFTTRNRLLYEEAITQFNTIVKQREQCK